MVTTIEESIDSIAQLVDYINELGHISMHMVKQMKDAWTSGYDGIWMNEEDNNTFGPLINVHYFHEDIHEKSHHELNGVLEKNEYLIQKQWAALKEKKKEGMVVELFNI